MTATLTTPQATLVGAGYSVYTRICQIALDIKRVPFVFETLDVFAEDGPAKARQAGHPFSKIPILRHGDLTLYETLSITRYIDDRFDGPPLQPEDPVDRARMNRIISIVDTQVYPILVWGLHVPKSEGREPDPELLDKGRTILSVLESVAQPPWLCGDAPTLADAYLTACMDCILDSKAAEHLPGHAPGLMAWWHRARPLLRSL